MIIVPEEGMHVEALQTKFPIIYWKVHFEGTMKYWKIIIVEPTDDKERALWVELKREFLLPVLADIGQQRRQLEWQISDNIHKRKLILLGLAVTTVGLKPRLWEETMLKPDDRDPNALDNLKPWRKYCFPKFIMISYSGKVATMRQSLDWDTIMLMSLRRMDLMYFQGVLRSDDQFNAQEYWLSIIREENLGLSRSHASTIRNLILRVIHRMITYGLCQRTTGHQNGYANVAWLIARWMKRKGAGTQKGSQICYGQFITKIARKARVLTDVVLRSLSALIYCRYLDTTTLRELIESEGRLIPEDP
ncbi:hypothetical protein Tco_0442085 [Tanacetum coccineum]